MRLLEQVLGLGNRGGGEEGGEEGGGRQRVDVADAAYASASPAPAKATATGDEEFA